MASARRIVWLHDPAGPEAPVRMLQEALHAAGHFVVAAVAPDVRRSRQTRWTPAPDGRPAKPISPPHREQDARLDDAERSRVLGVEVLRHGRRDTASRLARRAAAAPISETLRGALRALKPDLLVVSSWPRAASPTVEWMRAARAAGCPVACVVTDVSPDAWPWCEPGLVIVPAAPSAGVRALGYAGAMHSVDAEGPAAIIERLLALAAEPVDAVEPRVRVAPWRRLSGLSWRHRGMPWWVRPLAWGVDLLVGTALLGAAILHAPASAARWASEGVRRIATAAKAAWREVSRVPKASFVSGRTAVRAGGKAIERARKTVRRGWREFRNGTPRAFTRWRKRLRKAAYSGIRVIRARLTGRTP